MKRAGLAATIKARWICEQAHQHSVGIAEIVVEE
jgi:hypothetical protein